MTLLIHPSAIVDSGAQIGANTCVWHWVHICGKAKIGSLFDDFLKGEGTYEAVTALAVKRVLTWQIEQAMTDQGMSKASLATKMKTSRSQLDRLLDPDNDKVQLDTIQRAALAVGKKVVISLEDVRG